MDVGISTSPRAPTRNRAPPGLDETFVFRLSSNRAFPSSLVIAWRNLRLSSFVKSAFSFVYFRPDWSSFAVRQFGLFFRRSLSPRTTVQAAVWRIQLGHDEISSNDESAPSSQLETNSFVTVRHQRIPLVLLGRQRFQLIEIPSKSLPFEGQTYMCSTWTKHSPVVMFVIKRYDERREGGAKWGTSGPNRVRFIRPCGVVSWVGRGNGGVRRW